MAALALILGVLALAGWGLAAETAAGYRREVADAQVRIHIVEGCLSAACNELRYWERVRVAEEAEPPLTEIPAAFRQAFGEGEL